MSDVFGDINLVQVAMVDGQAPTARFLNGAFNQIDVAFSLLSQVIGDYDGEGEGEDTFVPSLVRAFGNLGWINCRLPANLTVPIGEGGGLGGILPFIVEDLDANFSGKKEACLTFLPAVEDATDGDVTSVNLGTAVATGDPVTENLAVADRFILDGKRVLTSSPIQAGASIQYPINTGSSLFRDSYGPETGVNTIPSMPQIFSGDALLCTISQPGGYLANEYRLDFPPITRIMNPQAPFSTTDDLDASLDMIQLDTGGPSPVRWSGTVPKYVIPEKILNLTSGTLIPYNMASLWFNDGGGNSRVRPVLSSDQFRWDTIPGTSHAVKVTVPDGFVLPADPGDPNENRYIVCFAGTSVADALLHERARALIHSHDKNDGAPVHTKDLFERFNPSHWFHSPKAYNHFPQYLERGGLLGDDPLNRMNAMLGVLHLGPVTATENNENTASSVAADSWPISFGHISLGPALFANASDTVLESGTSGKLVLSNTGFRVNEGNLFLGLEDGQEIGFDLDADAAPHPILDIRKYSGSLDVGYATVQLGQLYATEGFVGFDDRAEVSAPNLSFVAGGGLYIWSLLGDNVIDDTRLRVGGIETNSLVAPNADDPIVDVVGAESFAPYTGYSVDFLADGNLGFEGGTADFSDFTHGEVSADTALVRRAPLGESPFAAGNRGTVEFWQMEDLGLAGPNYMIRLLVGKLRMPGSLNRQRLANAGGTPEITVTGVKALIKSDGAVVASDGDALFLKLYRVRTRAAGVWALDGDGANMETIYRQELTEAEVGALLNGDGFAAISFDGGAVGDHTVDSDYDYFLFVAVQSPLDIDFFGCEVTFETNLVA